MITHALIDADILLYKSCSIVEKPMHWGDDQWTLHADAASARQIFDLEVADIKQATRANKVTLAFSSPGNFRIRLYPDYKANRQATRKPICYPEVKRYAMEAYDCVTYPALEGDDVIGMMATSKRPGTKFVIVSEDKDFKTIPGYQYNPRTGKRMRITKAMAIRNLFIQTLTGDRTDNYPGCPGIGDVKAQRILDEDCSWEAVVRTFQAAGLTEEDALLQARMARILHYGEYDHKTAEVKLWTPGTKSKTRVRVKSSPPEAAGTPGSAKADSTSCPPG